MKTKYFLKVLASALIISLGMVSCDRETVIDRDVNSPQEYVEVTLECSGEIIDIGQSPLSRSGGTDLYYLQVYTVVEYEGKEFYETYAHGLFSDPDNMKVRLLKNDKYAIVATMVKDGANVIRHDDNGYYYLPFNCRLENTFVHDNNFNVNDICFGAAEMVTEDNSSFLTYFFPSIDRYFGIVEGYVPSEGGTVGIDMEKMIFGLNVVTENFTEGSLMVDINGARGIVMDYPDVEAFRTYSLYYLYDTYYDYVVNDAGANEWVEVTVWWTDGTGKRHNIGQCPVAIYRNKITTIKIRIDTTLSPVSSGIDIIVDGTEMVVDPEGVTFG